MLVDKAKEWLGKFIVTPQDMYSEMIARRTVRRSWISLTCFSLCRYSGGHSCRNGGPLCLHLLKASPFRRAQAAGTKAGTGTEQAVAAQSCTPLTPELFLRWREKVVPAGALFRRNRVRWFRGSHAHAVRSRTGRIICPTARDQTN